jgi:drug/metabolite transporter (DMT)-like permease
MNNPKYLVIATIILWSLGPLLTRLISISSQLLSLDILFFFTFLFFLLRTTYHYKGKFLTKIKKISFSFLFFGLFGYFFYYLGLVQSFHLFNSASEPAILNYTFPLFTVIFTDLWFGKKIKRPWKIRFIEYLGVAIGFFAIVVLSTKGNIAALQITNLPAILWGLSAGVAYAIFSVYSSCVKAEDQDIFLFAGIFSSLLFAIIISFSEFNGIHNVTQRSFIANAVLAIIINGFGYLAWTRANRLAKEKNISISSIASLLFILPLLGLIIVSLILRETAILQPYFLVSLLGIIFSALFCQKSAAIFSFIEASHKRTT